MEKNTMATKIIGIVLTCLMIFGCASNIKNADDSKLSVKNTMPEICGEGCEECVRGYGCLSGFMEKEDCKFIDYKPEDETDTEIRLLVSSSPMANISHITGQTDDSFGPNAGKRMLEYFIGRSILQKIFSGSGMGYTEETGMRVNSQAGKLFKSILGGTATHHFLIDKICVFEQHRPAGAPLYVGYSQIKINKKDVDKILSTARDNIKRVENELDDKYKEIADKIYKKLEDDTLGGQSVSAD